ncbi:glycine-rich cell wall structural protein 2-like [Nymphaea colorata]|nr:glycine-rich cell wall structural protein 2-like [Nymphaea colorata]
MPTMKKITSSILSPLAVAALLLSTLVLAGADREETANGFEEELRRANRGPNSDGDPYGGIPGGFFPGGGFPFPGFGPGMGGGYGAGFGGPGGGYSRGGIYRPTVTCNTPGPCYRKRLACPASCFGSFSGSGKGYGYGGGGGGCTIDCRKKCIAYC